jgi:GTPase SAR1 family protein
VSCHAVAAPGDQGSSRLAEIVLVGHPNVGKSVLFGRLTGRHVTPGSQVTIVTLENLPVREHEQLLAYGVAPDASSTCSRFVR